MISLLLMLAAPVEPLNHQGLKLWGPFYVGQTMAEVKAVRPKSVALTPSCTANVYIDRNRDDLVTASIIEAKSAFDANRQECADAVLDGLKAKYGEPTTEVKTKPEVRNAFGRLIASALNERSWIFRNDGLRVTFTIDTNGNWRGRYSADEDGAAIPAAAL